MSEWFRFAVWCLVGGLFSLAFVGMLTIGPYVLVVALLALVLAVRSVGVGSMAGLVSGLGLVPLWVAWNNRAGPGETCETTTTSVHCWELYDPRGWAAWGIACLLAGIAIHALVIRARRRDKHG